MPGNSRTSSMARRVLEMLEPVTIMCVTPAACPFEHPIAIHVVAVVREIDSNVDECFGHRYGRT